MWRTVTTGVLVGIGFWPAPAAGQALAYEGALIAGTGKYIFTTRTTSLSLSSGLAWSVGPLTIRGSIPVIAQNTTLITTAGGGMGGIPSGGSRGSGAVSDSGIARRRRGGMAAALAASGGPVQAPSAISDYRMAPGDPTVGLGWRVRPSPRMVVTVGGAVKAPLSDTTDFGTGRWDYAGTVGVTALLSDRLSLGLDAAYWVLGDLPALDFANPVYGTLTLAGRVSAKWNVGAMVSGGTAALPGYAAPWSIGASLMHFSASGRAFGLTASVGLTETAAEFSAGALWRVGLF